MSLLIIGGDGLIGKYLQRACFEQSLHYRATSRRDSMGGDLLKWDLEGEPSTWEIPRASTVAVICAAATRLSECESNPRRARKVNVEAPTLIARILQEKGLFIILLSTSLVFGGHRQAAHWNDPLQPETAYGRQKADAESAIMATGPQVAILRITKVVHPGLRLFTDWEKCLRRGVTIEPFNDVVFSPVPVNDVADAILEIARAFEPGIFQLSGERDITYAEAATLLASRIVAPVSLIKPRSWRSAAIDVAFAPRHTTLMSRLPGGKTMRYQTVEETLSAIFGHYQSGDGSF
jgi:dTDP-4-dehydrorhamnose reductase